MAANGVDLVGSTDREGIRKRVSIRQEGDYTIVRHRLVNDGSVAVDTAPWAITQMVTGDIAILPQTRRNGDENGLLPNRSLVLWPYTDLGAVEIGFDGDHVTVEGSERRSKTKLGYVNRRGWMAYVPGGQIFVKWSSLHRDGKTYADLGASAQCYRDERFLELETLAPVEMLEPGRAVTHVETWRIFDLEGRDPRAILDTLPVEPEGDPL